MKFSLFVLALLSPIAHADDVITCSGHGQNVIVTQSRFNQSVTHNGFTYSDCRRINMSASLVGFECQDRAGDRGVQVFVHLTGNRVSGGDVAYHQGGSFFGGPEDGSGIELSCK